VVGVPRTLDHNADEAGSEGSSRVESSGFCCSLNPNAARYGNGQYISDIQPGTMSCAQLSRCFLGRLFQGARFTHYVEIDVEGLQVVMGRRGAFVVPGESPLDPQIYCLLTTGR